MKRVLIIVWLAFCVFQLKAQNMAEVFVSMPDEYVPQLEDAWRKDLVDLYNSGENAQLKNNMNGTSRLVKLTKDYLLLESTERTTLELKLLPLVNNTFVICKIITVKAPVADSRIAFFSPDWKPLNASDLLEPVTGGKALSTQELIRMADAAGFFDNQETMGKGKSEYTGKISRKLCARFLWNLYVRNMGDSTLFTRYYNRYEKYGKSPLEDVDLENPDFNGIIGCVEKEIMTVPEGTRFYPDGVVPGGDFLGWIKNLEKGL